MKFLLLAVISLLTVPAWSQDKGGGQNFAAKSGLSSKNGLGLENAGSVSSCMELAEKKCNGNKTCLKQYQEKCAKDEASNGSASNGGNKPNLKVCAYRGRIGLDPKQNFNASWKENNGAPMTQEQCLSGLIRRVNTEIKLTKGNCQKPEHAWNGKKVYHRYSFIFGGKEFDTFEQSYICQ